MNTTTRLVLVAVGMAALMGCGDAEDPGHEGSVQEAISCGSAALFATTHEGCDPMDATGVAGDDGTMCRCVLGFAWNGDACEALSGCACEGADCSALSETEEGCLLAHASCTGATPQFTCGSKDLYALTHSSCQPMDASAAPAADGSSCYCALGYAWDGDSCEQLADCQCVGADCDKLAETREACEQAHGACGTVAPQLHCGDAQLFAFNHNACAAMDAEAIGDEQGMACNCMLGFKWDGDSCEALANCTCQGRDCDKLAETREDCELAHAACAAPEPRLQCGSATLYSLQHGACEAMDAVAVPDDSGSSCYCFLGFAWNGAGCVPLSDCACAGTDCDKLTQTEEQCLQAHAGC